ncbi:hypothetical protein [Mesorhizobium sp. CAU 1732]|uniref:hypothetical protein n=1 Tax=Mesorhizobium sp. CAU 1732 TaxID=3140358 RepID=UPI003261560A
MQRAVAMAAIGIILSACGSSGPVYRGAPPAGYTDEQYSAKLRGTALPESDKNTYKDASNAGGPGASF